MSAPDKLTEDQTHTHEPILSDFTLGNALGPGWSTEPRAPGWKAALAIAIIILSVCAGFFAVVHYWQ